MAYDKPKVTIDLEEYQDLIKKSKEDSLVLAKTVVCLMLMAGSKEEAMDRIKSRGIKIRQVNIGGPRTEILPEDIVIEKIK
jgi:hypothetical protein